MTLGENQLGSVHLISMDRGQKTSFHYHHIRNEIFMVLDNEAVIQMWDKFVRLRKHEAVRVPAGVPHRVIALDRPCRVLELAEGFFDQGRDIVRLEDTYPRKTDPEGVDDGRI